jgi:hypothetical protein
LKYERKGDFVIQFADTRSRSDAGNDRDAIPSPITPPDDAELERLGDEIAELAAHVHAATYHLLVRLHEFDERCGWSGGFKSCAHWLSWRTGIAPGAAREKVRVARALVRLPLLSEAMRRGELSFAKVRAATRVATLDNEQHLLELGRHGTAAHMEKVVRAWRKVNRLEESKAENERHAKRHLTLMIDDDGSYVLRARLDPEVGALVARALDAAQLALFGKNKRETVDAEIEPPAPAQRRADAIALIAETALRSDAFATGSCEITDSIAAARDGVPAVDSPQGEDSRRASRFAGRADRFQVVVHVDAEALREGSESGQSVLGDGIRVPAETSRRIACDASCVVMTHDADGEIVAAGRRTRIVPPAIRRALEYRDRGCRFPGCDSRFCDAHHLVHWADGGATRLDNLALLCRTHHRAVHEGRYRLRMLKGGDIEVFRPDGRRLPHCPDPPRLPYDPVSRLKESHRGSGLVIDAWTPTPRGCGERLDLDYTIRVFSAVRA